MKPIASLLPLSKASPLKRGADPDERAVRGVRWRLTALTVGLLTALVIALSLSVYLPIKVALKQSLEDQLNRRVNTALHVPIGRGLLAYGFFGKRDAGGVELIIADSNLQPLFAPVSSSNSSSVDTLWDPGTAHQVLATAQQQVQQQSATIPDLSADAQYSDVRIDNQPSLLYTMPVLFPDGSLGILQASISEQQYLDTLHSLLMVLLAVGALGVFAATAISGVVVRRALVPIQMSLRRQRDFVADAAHELRTPLAIMRTAAELSLSGGDVDQETALEQTLAQNAHLTRLVDSLSLLARADSGAVTLERQPVDLSQLVKQTADGVAILAEERDVRLTVETPDGVRLLGDAGRLRQLLLIMLDNALKHTPDGGWIDVSVLPQGNRVRLQVRDTGPGIDPQDLPHIFDRFYRANRARTSGEGMGLGLAIGRWIAEAHGGSISAANAADGGAIFTVLMPLR